MYVPYCTVSTYSSVQAGGQCAPGPVPMPVQMGVCECAAQMGVCPDQAGAGKESGQCFAGKKSEGRGAGRRKANEGDKDERQGNRQGRKKIRAKCRPVGEE